MDSRPAESFVAVAMGVLQINPDVEFIIVPVTAPAVPTV